MRRKWTTFCVSLLFVAHTGAAQDDHSIFGPGAASCDAMLNKVAEAPVAQMLFVAWAQGYLSGLNMVRMGQNQPAVHLDATSSLYPSLEGHCRQNPQDSVTDAASSLYASLLADQGLGTPASAEEQAAK